MHEDDRKVTSRIGSLIVCIVVCGLPLLQLDLRVTLSETAESRVVGGGIEDDMDGLSNPSNIVGSEQKCLF